MWTGCDRSPMHGLRGGGVVSENLHGKWDSTINNS
jgi:hypothetical protein